MEFTGQIKHIGNEETNKNFTKREVTIINTENEKYPNQGTFEFSGDRVNQLSDFTIGDTVKVQFNLNGRDYLKDGKTIRFNTLKAWKIENASM